MKLICITGIDGTGKTTLARSTTIALCQQGVSAVYIYGRTYPVLSRILMAIGRTTLLRGRNQWNDYSKYTTDKKRTMRNPLLAGIYKATILIDYYIQIWLKLLPYLFKKSIVISDRYIYDTVISDLTVHLNYSSEKTFDAIERGLKCLPKPIMTILIDVPEGVAFARKDDVPHIDYLRERRSWYLLLANRPEVKYIDGQHAPDLLVQELLREINSGL